MSAGRVVCLGEILVDFVAGESGSDVGQALTFTKSAGGAVANTAMALARLGAPVSFIGKVGADPFGRFLRSRMESVGVDVSRLGVSKNRPTGLVFVALDDRRVPSYYFVGAPSADMDLDENDVDREAVEGAAFVHAGTVSMSREPARSAAFKLMRLARDAGVPVSFDPNLRLHLWDDPAQMKRISMEAAALADLVKLNGEELAMLAGKGSEEDGARKFLALGARAVVVTRGPGGAAYYTQDGSGLEPGFQVDAVDTTGAGDAFAAGLLASLMESGFPPSLADLGRASRTANAMGALCATALGAVAGLPDRRRLEEFLNLEACR